jgi:hypothetical protein
MTLIREKKDGLQASLTANVTCTTTINELLGAIVSDLWLDSLSNK